ESLVEARASGERACPQRSFFLQGVGPMPNRRNLITGVILAMLVGGVVLLLRSAVGQNRIASLSQRPHDAVAAAQTPREIPAERPEQKKTAHDLSDIFTPSKAQPSSEALTDQAEHGKMNGFDFYRDPLGAMKPGTTFEEIFRAAVAEKPKVKERQ